MSLASSNTPPKGVCIRKDGARSCQLGERKTAGLPYMIAVRTEAGPEGARDEDVGVGQRR